MAEGPHGVRHDPGPARTLFVAGLVCLACSLLVSTTAALLAPRHRANRERERREHVRALIARQPGLAAVVSGVEEADVQECVVELATGAPAPWIDAAELDPASALRDPLASLPLSPEADLLGLGRVPVYAKIYLVRDAHDIALVLLPVHGPGYGGAMRGYVALGPDANTVVGLSFYEHAETPGVGGALLEDEDWLGEWRGKRVRDGSGIVRIGTAPGEVDPRSPDAAHRVDAVSGATRTTAGVGDLLGFWLGDAAFGPFLLRVARGEVPR